MAQNGTYPVSTARVRPFRVYDEQNRRVLQGKVFGSVLNAHNAAQIYAKWYLPLGKSVTVLDTKGNDLGQYTRRLYAVHASPNAPDSLADIERQQRKGEQYV